MKVITDIIYVLWCLICYVIGIVMGERRARKDHDMMGTGCRWEQEICEIRMELMDLCKSPIQYTREVARFLLNYMNEIEKRSRK